MFRFRLRTLLVLAILGPPLLAGVILYGERPFNDFVRWLNRPPQTVRIIPLTQPAQTMPDEGNPNP